MNYLEFELATTDLLEAEIAYDLAGSGMYLDDDIGEQDFNDDVGQVREEMVKALWDCYNDNIGEIVNEQLGSDFKGTI